MVKIRYAESPWPAREEELIAHWHWRSPSGEQRSTIEIGRIMGLSKNAVVGKAHRLKLEPRTSPILRNYGPKRPKSERQKLQRKARQPEIAEIMRSLANSSAALREISVNKAKNPAPVRPPRVQPAPVMTGPERPHMPLRTLPDTISAEALALAPIQVPLANAMQWGAQRGCYELPAINRKRLQHSLPPFEIEQVTRGRTHAAFQTNQG